jgi:hypothetical protein
LVRDAVWPRSQQDRRHNLSGLVVVGVALTIGFAFTIYGMAALFFALICLMAGIERLSR